MIELRRLKEAVVYGRTMLTRARSQFQWDKGGKWNRVSAADKGHTRMEKDVIIYIYIIYQKWYIYI